MEKKPKRKVFYVDDDQSKPVLAGGVILMKGEEPKLFVQKVKKEEGEGHFFSDFGGKVDNDDTSYWQSISRELGEETNYAIYIKRGDRKVYIDDKGIEKMLREEVKNKIYLPTAKYYILFVNFDENKYGIDYEKIGDHETHDLIERTAEWINAKEFINAHFNHELHPRLWSKNILQYLGYKGQEELTETSSKITPPKKFAFKSSSL